MLLSDLVRYRQIVTDMKVKAVAEKANADLSDMKIIVRDHPCQFGSLTEKLEINLADVNESFEKFNLTIQELIKQIDQNIALLHNRYCRASYQLYREEMIHESTDYILNRRFGEMSSDVYQYLHDRVHLYNRWHYPALIIRPGLETFIKNTVACDPLYIADQHLDLLKPCLEFFPEKFSRRIRRYVFDEYNESKPILHALPDNQFGLILAYNYINFRPFELVEKWLRETFDKLLPGGVFIFTFNNCDLAHGVRLTEMNFMCYTPGRLVEQLAKNIGYEIVFRYDTHSPNTWIELKKPGDFVSIKGGQCLAEIKNKIYMENL